MEHRRIFESDEIAHLNNNYYSTSVPKSEIKITFTFRIHHTSTNVLYQSHENNNVDLDNSIIPIIIRTSPKMQNWLDKNTKGKYFMTEELIWFEFNEDAVAFKLAW